MYICVCNAVTEQAIRDAAARGARTVDALAFDLGVGAGCGGCREAAQSTLDECERRCSHAANGVLHGPMRNAA